MPPVTPMGTVMKDRAEARQELGRATWTLLHTLAAQYPDRPTKSQQRDVRNMLDILTRMYPCAECAKHFKEVLRYHPPEVDTGPQLQQYMCRVHNVVNAKLGKPAFNCGVAGARWRALDCEEDGRDACSLQLPERELALRAWPW